MCRIIAKGINIKFRLSFRTVPARIISRLSLNILINSKMNNEDTQTTEENNKIKLRRINTLYK